VQRLNRLLLVVAAALVLTMPQVQTHGADADAVKKELAKLQGEWKMVTGVADGYPVPDEMLSSAKRVCKGDELTVTIGGEVVMKAKITLDPSKSPKTIDYQVIDGPTKGKKHLGIYALDGDTLKSCFAAPDGERPKEFGSKEGDKMTYSVWKRSAESSKSGEKK
jgi:uncharacterized protein (TIGR03067 family)